MSAITGIFYRDGRNVDPQLIKKMNDILSHRGPNGSATWCEGPVGLGHQMLWTTQESLQETLPLEEDGLVITADARIDNRAELSQELDIEDTEHVADSYFILKAYQKWGEDCPDKLLGDFAFAIWDKNKEQLFCARDHMGVKPFYYYLDDDMFVFGTEIKALHTSSDVPYKLNELQLAFYLSGIYNERTFTFYEDIYRLPAANYIKIINKKIDIQKYWKLDPNLKIELKNDKEYAQKFLEIFTEAVKCRLRSAKPIGFELSGGLDSSSVVCVAKEILSKNNDDTLNTFSIVFEDIIECDESYYIKKVVDSGRIKPYYLKADNISPLDNIENILKYLEEPFYVNNRSIAWILSEKMQDNNIRVVLTGMDGDSTLSQGHNYLKELIINLKWGILIKEINIRLNQFNRDFRSLFINDIILPIIPENILKFVELNIKKNPKILFNNKEFIKKVKYRKYFNIYQKYIFSGKNAREYHYKTIVSEIHQSILEVVDRNSAPFFIESRHPFYDKRLIEFCYSIPTEQKIRSGWGRWILRYAMEGILPKEIQWRHTKNNFAPIRDKNLLSIERKRLNYLIYENSNILNDYIDLNELNNIYQKYEHRSKGYAPKLIEKVVLLIIWLKQTEITKNKHLYM